MAWPPASSGTWSVRHQFTGAEYPRPSHIYYLSDTQIIFGDAIGVAIYDAVNGTATVIGSADSPNDWGLGDVGNLNFTIFEDNLYVAVSSYFDASEAQKVFRWDGIAHSWTLVYLYENAGVLGGHTFNIMTSTSHLVISSSSIEGNYIKKTTNPGLATWSTLSSSDFLGDYPSVYIRNDGFQSYASVTDGVTPYIGQFISGFFNDIGAPVGTYVRMPGYHWNTFGSDYSIDGTNWLTANVADAEPINLRNYTKFVGFDDSANRLYFWDDANDEWAATFDTLTPSNMSTPYGFVMSDGTPILGRYSGSTAQFYQRSVAFDITFIPEEPATGKRLWIYKGNGIDWVSRGIRVEQ